MDRKEQIAEMTKANGGSSYIRRKDVAWQMNYKDPHCVDKYLVGLERIGMLYFVPDVVDSINNHKEQR